jgi:hypothetical protein
MIDPVIMEIDENERKKQQLKKLTDSKYENSNSKRKIMRKKNQQ